MRNRWLPFAGATLAVLLGACGPTAAAPSTATGKPRPSVPASGAGIWFAPTPADPHDLLALAESNALWTRAAATTAVFQLSASSVSAMSGADLATLGTGLNRTGLPVALLVPALTPVMGCGQVAGHVDASAAPDLLRRMKSAGMPVRFVVMDQPAAAGSACHLSSMEIATNVAAWTASVRALVPQVAIGDAEPLSQAADMSAYAAWMPAYATVTGSPLAFLHLDIDWSLAGWTSQVVPLQQSGQQNGTALGLVERGNPDDATDAIWSATAADRMAAIAASGVRPASTIFQSAGTRTPRLLPESDPTTFTALINRSTGTRSVLTLTQPTPATNGGQLVGGRLIDAAGAPIAGAPVDLTVRSLNAPGTYTSYGATGTVPAGISRALVGVRVAGEGTDPGAAELFLYHASFQEGGPANQRVQNPDFAAGMSNWGATPNPDLVRIEPSDRGTGQMLHITDAAPEFLALNSEPFPVTPGAAYTVRFDARITPVSRGYFTLIFLSQTEVSRLLWRFAPAVVVEHAVTDAAGRLQWQVPASAVPAEFGAHYAGDRTRWPASATN